MSKFCAEVSGDSKYPFGLGQKKVIEELREIVALHDAGRLVIEEVTEAEIASQQDFTRHTLSLRYVKGKLS